MSNRYQREKIEFRETERFDWFPEFCRQMPFRSTVKGANFAAPHIFDGAISAAAEVTGKGVGRDLKT